MIDYDPHAWRSHLFDIKGSVVRQIFGRILTVVLWSAVVSYVDIYRVHVGVSEKPHALIGVAIGLLLVFRTNASYDRFWEGRRMWGSIINETRNLGRASVVLLAAAPDVARTLLAWTMIFPVATMQKLRGERGLGPVADRLPADVVKPVQDAQHQPLAVAVRMTQQLAEARRRGVVSDYQQMTLDQNVQQLIDYIGACERIHSTPLPFAYVVHLRRLLILYCISLPFALVDGFGWWTVAGTFFIAFTLCGIEEIGVEIEDPFGLDDNDLPLERFCAIIEKNLTEVEALLPTSER